MSEARNENEKKEGEDKIRVRRNLSKRIEKAQRESEELIKTMGGSLDVEGGRRTRSSARGGAPPVRITPPPTKKLRSSNTSRRGRGKKLESRDPIVDDRSPDKAAEVNPEEIGVSDTPNLINMEKELDIDNCNVNDTAEKPLSHDEHNIDTTTLEQTKSEKIKEDTESIGEQTKNNDVELTTLPKNTTQPDKFTPSDSLPEPDKKLDSTPDSSVHPPESMEVDGSATANEDVSTKVSSENVLTDLNQPMEKSCESLVEKVSDTLTEEHKTDDSKKDNDVSDCPNYGEPELLPTTNSGDIAAQVCN